MARRRARPCSPRTILGATGDGRRRGSLGVVEPRFGDHTGPGIEDKRCAIGRRPVGGKERIKRVPCYALDRDFQIDHRCLGLFIKSDMPPHRGSAKALTRQRLPSRVIANATQEFVKPRCRMVRDAAPHVGKPSLPINEPSSARARPDGPVTALRCPEHVPSRSRTLPGNRISHGQGRFWALLKCRVDMTSDALIS